MALCNPLPLCPAVPKWVEMPKDSQLEESKPGYLHCLSKASLKPTVTWYRNGVSISEVRQGKPCPLWAPALLLLSHLVPRPSFPVTPTLSIFLALPTDVWVHSWLSLATWLAVSPVLLGQGQEKGPCSLSQFSVWVSAGMCLSEACCGTWSVSSATSQS